MSMQVDDSPIQSADSLVKGLGAVHLAGACALTGRAKPIPPISNELSINTVTVAEAATIALLGCGSVWM